MSQRIIAIVSEKGGSGRTTTAVGLACALAGRCQRTLVVDLDPQGHASLLLDAADGRGQMAAVLAGDRPIRGAIQPTAFPLVDVLSGGPELRRAAVCITDAARREDLPPGMLLRQRLGDLDAAYATIIIDCPAGVGLLTNNALLAATDVLVTCEADGLTLHSLPRTLELIDELSGLGLNRRLTRIQVLPCRVDQRSHAARDVMEDLRRILPDRLALTMIRHSTAVVDATREHRPIELLSPACHAAKDYRALSFELIDDREPATTVTPAANSTPADGAAPAKAATAGAS